LLLLDVFGWRGGTPAEAALANQSEDRRLVAGFGGDGSDGGTEGEPFGGSDDTLEHGTPARDAQGIVSFPAESLGLGLFVF
jgi:hypothetical protein